jgi:hypothetical protein
MGGTKERTARAGSKWRRRIGSSVGIAAVFGIAMLMAGGVAAWGIPPSDPPIKAPYYGLEASDVLDQLSGSGGPICGVSGSFPVMPFFNLTTGHFYETATAKAQSCGPGSSFAYPEADAGFISNNNTTTSGLHHIKANLIADFAVSLVATPGSTTQSAEAFFIETTELYVIDATNGSAWENYNGPYVVVQITSGTFHHHYIGLHQTVELNATLVKGHEYYFGVFLNIGAYAGVSPGDSTAYATINMGSFYKNAVLSSVTGL